MMRTRILYELLKADGNYISGKLLAEQLGVSRVAIWKHIEILKNEGYDIIGVSHRGYCLQNQQDIIHIEELMDRLNTQYIGDKIEVLTTVDSTNQVARERLQTGEADSGGVIVARTQMHGRGRRGRSWISPPGGLWFSVILRPDLPMQDIPLLSLTFAVAIAQALDEYVSEVQIKWPNDVFIHGKKVAGILLEMSGEIDQMDYLIAGIGVNVNVHEQELSDELGAIATSLSQQAGKKFNLSEVLACLLQSMDDQYRQLLEGGFESILEVYKSRCLHLGKAIQIHRGSQLVEGINIDVDSRGTLIVQSGDTLERIHTGDVYLLGNQEEKTCT
jgi:BirA family biotin operon repressor/biotin-[acetyl-CoA-carboxylase] ligase